jgi:hypothetical protein
MGYDLGECLICYCHGYGNNPTPQRHICADCFFKTGCTALRGRAYSYSGISLSAKCSFCCETKVCIANADICSGCSQSLNPSNRELETEELEEETCQDQSCSCPHCPRNTIEGDVRNSFAKDINSSASKSDSSL